MTDLAWLSATDALSMFRSLTLSPVELTQALIDRAEKVDPQVNAFTYKYFEEALEAAKQSEMRYMNGTARPLEAFVQLLKMLAMSKAFRHLRDH